ncbi:carbon-nitrogen hydrolase family protein [Magnetospirillum molischianum]|uniref:Putative nitrilase n=1 Tax=Magnetospirillum molischianum DSM 120 TaxID=1150626 RepID=H8FTM7_MAGML|nr:carbon-nitrogen hydrolase family protein [Magnetospirillum molischianum]CCG41734.1 putative nitrilase [Magnetospirillum molischianum DSM 120]
MKSFKAACLQVNSGTDMMRNCEVAATLAVEARAAGADLILMPENVALMEWGRSALVLNAAAEEDHPALAFFRDLSREIGVWLHLGSLHILLDGGMIANRSFVIDPLGEIRARYDKIHMFDVDLGLGEVYRESSTFSPGNRSVAADLPWGRLGLSICYDLRFPQLYRDLAQAGCDFLTVPAAFTRTTGKAHWHVLLRARAIETGCYVFAPAQCGEHVNNRQTYGHALIVSPWGEILADALEQPGWVIAEIDPRRVGEARRKIPCLDHDRPFVPLRM